MSYLWAKWSPPPLADASFNSHVYHYELRLKPEEKEEWEVREKCIYFINSLFSEFSCLSLIGPIKMLVCVRTEKLMQPNVIKERKVLAWSVETMKFNIFT